jgi:hypothetical protein
MPNEHHFGKSVNTTPESDTGRDRLHRHPPHVPVVVGGGALPQQRQGALLVGSPGRDRPDALRYPGLYDTDDPLTTWTRTTSTPSTSTSTTPQLTLNPADQQFGGLGRLPKRRASTPQLERAWDAWQAERHRRGEIDRRPACTSNPFRRC